MKPLLILLILFSFSLKGFGQESQIIKQAKEDLKKLSNEFVLKEREVKIQDSIFKSLTTKINTYTSESDFDKLKKQQQTTKKISDKLDSVYSLAQNHIAVYESKGVKKDSLSAFFPYKHELNKTADTEEIQTQKTYLYFGKNKVIAENDGFFKDKTANLILNEILEAKSENYLGDFIIPQKGQKIVLYEDTTTVEKSTIHLILDKKTKERIDSKKRLKFQKVRVHILEGSVYDLQIFLTDDRNNEYLFENKVPISLLRYTKLSPLNHMFFKLAVSNNPDTEINKIDCKDLSIKLSDVLTYIPNPGENYVPDDLTLELPTKTDVPENTHQSVRYKVQQNTALQNIVELRTYTDFLGLFSDAPNGIVQLEGKADFFVNPFNLRNRSVYFFKKISPFVSFSKLDEDVRYLTLEPDGTGGSKIKNSLEIVEKAYLQMGMNVNVLSFKFTKEYPFSINLYVPARYQIADIKMTDSLKINYKSLGLGGGLLLDFKRYNNFGFTYSLEFTNYNANSFNTEPTIINPDRFWVFKNEAEVYYNPATDKQQAIFLRLKTFNNSTKNNSESFYQLQFGYRFSIGISKLKQ
ncbi:MAG: hypothetical protein ACOH1N_08155 [Lutibacter sp.]